MSKSDGNHPSLTLLAESFAHNGVLVDQEYEQEIRRALEALKYVVGPAERAGRHGLLRISVDGDASADKLFKDLHEELQRSQSPALGNFGRDRHFAIGALGSVRPAGGAIADGSDPKIIGSGGIRPPQCQHVLSSAQASRTLVRSSDSAGLGVVVGVLDTAISSHAYLVGGFVASPASMRSYRPNERIGAATAHATFVTGLILQQAPAATVHVSRVLPDSGVCDSVTLHDAIIDIARQPISILNLSLGCHTDDDRPPFVLQRAIRKFRQRRPDAIIVAAAGNHPDGKKFWPAALSDVLAVTVADQDGDRGWDESADYPTGHWVDVTAPGQQVISTFLSGTFERPDGRSESYEGWGVGNGTSFACAIAAGYLARNWEPGRDRNQLPRIARNTPVPRTRSGDRLVLGRGDLVG
jgi:hypothetical protein